MPEEVKSQRELRTELSRLEAAIAEQTEWLKEWHLDVVGHSVGKVNGNGNGDGNGHGAANAQAPFRNWYYGQTPGLFDDSPVFAALGFSLESMQAQARQLVRATQAGQVFPFGEYREFMDAVVSFNDLVFKLQRESWHQLSRVDELTGLGNDQAMRDQIAIERERTQRTGLPTCVALAQLTDFQPVDDDAGKISNAEALVCLAEALEDNLRLYDRVYRYESDIFLICLPNTDADVAEQVVKRLHGLITQKPLQLEDQTKLNVLTIFGIGPVLPADSVSTIVTQVTAALRRASEDSTTPVASWDTLRPEDA